MKKQQFASDNYSPLCPEALDYFLQANDNHQRPYGDDRWTEMACGEFRRIFNTHCEIFFVTTGTAANALSLSAMCQSYHSIICHPLAHIETDECGAPEFYSNGAKLLLADDTDGKLTPDAIAAIFHARDDIHYPKPQTVSITEATETGRVYKPEEIAAIGKVCRELGLTLHMDGARFANAVASLNVQPEELTWKSGVDVLSMGGTKNGMAFCEAVVFFNKTLAQEFDFRCKQSGHLISKMRYSSAQWYGMLKTGAWLKHAAHANNMAELLEKKLKTIDTIKLLYPREANSLFITMPQEKANAMEEKGWLFYDFIAGGGYRLVCSWDTEESTIDEFINDLL
jgi:threonine aldolase